ncbi:hypothetical protein [Ohtaekwangia sp.]|uniref:hypothetical protein n=1 Tax=Ohtaekwangia sp. TaxID=2066019 RepID=UPI002F91F246
MNLSTGRGIILDQKSYGFNEYIPEIPCIRHEVTGFKTSSDVRECFNLILDYVAEKKQIHENLGILFDIRSGKAVSGNDLKWIGTDWQPRVVGMGIRYIAMVIPNYPLAELNAEVSSDDHDQDNHRLTKRFFCDHDAALSWLKEVLN